MIYPKLIKNTDQYLDAKRACEQLDISLNTFNKYYRDEPRATLNSKMPNKRVYYLARDLNNQSKYLRRLHDHLPITKTGEWHKARLQTFSNLQADFNDFNSDNVFCDLTDDGYVHIFSGNLAAVNPSGKLSRDYIDDLGVLDGDELKNYQHSDSYLNYVKNVKFPAGYNINNVCIMRSGSGTFNIFANYENSSVIKYSPNAKTFVKFINIQYIRDLKQLQSRDIYYKYCLECYNELVLSLFGITKSQNLSAYADFDDPDDYVPDRLDEYNKLLESYQSGEFANQARRRELLEKLVQIKQHEFKAWNQKNRVFNKLLNQFVELDSILTSIDK